jgi:hypothetical protein
MRKIKEFVIEKGMILKRKSWDMNQAVIVLENPRMEPNRESKKPTHDYIFPSNNYRDRNEKEPATRWFFAHPWCGDKWVRVTPPKGGKKKEKRKTAPTPGIGETLVKSLEATATQA